MTFRRTTVLVLALAHVAVHVGTALKIEMLQTADLEHEFVALHVKLHNVAAGLREQLKSNNGEIRKAPMLPMLVKFQQGLERTLSDTVYMKEKRVALAELKSADTSLEHLTAPYKNWLASHRSYKLAADSGILLETGKLSSSLETQLSKMEKAFQANKRRQEKRLNSLRIRAAASATKSNKDALKREEASFNKLSTKRAYQFAKIRTAVAAAKSKDPSFLFAFVHAVHSATVDDNVHAVALQ